MSNIVPTNIQIPAHLEARVGQVSALSQSLSGGITSGPSFPRISLKGSRFRIREDGAETVLDVTSLDTIIVGANPQLSKTYYAAEWDKDAEPTAPDCFSLGGIHPSAESAQPQSDLCASCPHNAWGSKIGPQGQKLKMCTDQKRLAVVSADDPTGPVYLLQVTPAALKGLNTYHKELSMRGIPVDIVKTKLSFDTDASFPKLNFSFGGFIDESTYSDVERLFGSDEVLEITGEKEPDVAAEPSKPRKAAVKAKPEPEPEPEPEVVAEVVAEETPKRGFGAAKAAPAKAKPKAAAKPKVAAKPEPEPAAEASEVDTLAAAISGLLGGDDDD